MRSCLLDNESLDVLNKQQSHVMRNTGDVGRIINGEIYCCGRLDNRVKHNGQIICLDALKRTIDKNLQIEQSFCLLQHNELCLYVKVAEDIQIMDSQIMEVISKQLSTSYIPDEIIFIDKFPITSHGKINQHALKKNILHQSVYDITNLKEYLQKIWNSCLKSEEKSLAPFSTGNNFVKLGGDSFSAAFLVNQISKYILSVTSRVVSYEELFHKILMGTFGEVVTYLEIFCKQGPSVDKLRLHRSPDRRISIKETTRKRDKIECLHFYAIKSQNKDLHCECWNNTAVHLTEKPYKNKRFLALNEEWKYDLRKCIDASPLILMDNDCKDGVIYIGSHSHIFAAISVKHGKKVWETVLGDRIESSATVSVDGKLICVGKDLNQVNKNIFLFVFFICLYFLFFVFKLNQKA